MSKGYRRPPDIAAELRKAERAAERAIKQAGSDIAVGGRALVDQGKTAVRKVREGARRIKNSTKR